MKKVRHILIVLFLYAAGSFAQNDSTLNTVYISGQIVGAENQKISLGNQNLGGVNNPVFTTTADAKGNFVIETGLPFEDYYFLRFENGQTLNLILFQNDSISIFGDCSKILTYSNFIGSIHSTAMNDFLRVFVRFKKIEDSLKLVVRTNPGKQAEVNEYFAPIASNFYEFRNKFINGNTQSPSLVVTFNTINTEKEWDLYKKVMDLVEAAFPNSPTILKMRDYVVKMQAQKDALKFLQPGNPAKEIALLDTSRAETIKLSELKGKVVLIDFWASWCRPCRAENPTVVRLYNKYNKDGFDVYSVSLDGDVNRWKQAIKQDGLVWPNHVSDLKKWSSLAAKDYSVTSIPFTVLIDAEGNIIATKLRGEALENQLKLIFGH